MNLSHSPRSENMCTSTPSGLTCRPITIPNLWWAIIVLSVDKLKVVAQVLHVDGTQASVQDSVNSWAISRPARDAEFEPLRPTTSREATRPWGGSDLSNLRYFKFQLSKWQRKCNACHFLNEMHKISSSFFVNTPALPLFDVVVLPNTWLDRVAAGTPHSFDACKIRTPSSTAPIVPWRSKWSTLGSWSTEA